MKQHILVTKMIVLSACLSHINDICLGCFVISPDSGRKLYYCLYLRNHRALRSTLKHGRVTAFINFTDSIYACMYFKTRESALTLNTANKNTSCCFKLYAYNIHPCVPVPRQKESPKTPLYSKRKTERISFFIICN